MFYEDQRAEIIKLGEGKGTEIGGRYGTEIGGRYGEIEAYYCEKSVALFSETFFISSNHTGILSKKDAIDKEIQNKSSAVIIDGLSYRNKGKNGQLDKSILKAIGSGERIPMKDEKEPIVIVGGYPNYGHFVFEFLPKIVEGLRLFGNKYEFVINDSITKWIDLANVIGQGMIGAYPRFRIIPYDSCITSNSFILIESTRAEGLKYISSKENLNLIQEKSAKGIEDIKKDSPGKVYLKRSNSVKWRKIINAEEVRNYWEKRGYVIVEMGKLTQREQVNILCNCTHIIIEAGADSMAPSLCKKGCRILELLPDGMVAGFGSATSQYALEHYYKRIYGKRTEINTGKYGIDYDYKIDITKFEEISS